MSPPKKSGRRERDAYYTPEWATAALIRHFTEIEGGILYDPCCGDGRMGDQLYRANRFGELWLNDISPEANCESHSDATTPAAWEPIDDGHPPPEWVISNPPFLHAGEIVHLALRHAQAGVAMLLRCTFGEPCKGREWLKDRPPTALLMLPRISFTGDGKSDSAPCWWFIWSEAVRPRIVVAGRAESAGQEVLAL